MIIAAQHLGDGGLDRAGVKVIGLGVVVGGGGDDHIVGMGIGMLGIGGGLQVQGHVLQVVGQVGIFDRRATRLDRLHFMFHGVIGHDLMVLGQQDGIGQAHIAQASDCDFHGEMMR